MGDRIVRGVSPRRVQFGKMEPYYNSAPEDRVQPPQPPQEFQPSHRRKRKKLNIPAIKGVVMMVVGTFFGFLTALTGISPQVAAVGMIVFLLGFKPARAQGTALAYALCTAIGSV